VVISKGKERAMFRTHLLIAAISFPLLVSGCGDDTAPPTGARTESPRPSARVSTTAVDRFRFQLRRVGAEALFERIDPTGCVVTDVDVLGAEDAVKQGPGKPTTGPFAVAFIFEVDVCAQQVLRDIFGFTDDVVFQANRNKLTQASLQATITAVDNLSGAEVPIEVDVAWSGTGVLVSQSDRFRIKTPSTLMSQWFKGTFRDAAASGSVVVDGENLATDAALLADIFRLRTGNFEIVRTKSEPPDSSS
jgi:hypothetical protein